MVGCQSVLILLFFHFSRFISERYMFWGAKDKVLGGKRPCFGGQKTVFCTPKHISFRDEGWKATGGRALLGMEMKDERGSEGDDRDPQPPNLGGRVKC